MGEIVQQNLQAVQRLDLGVQVKLDQLPDEPDHLYLGLDVDLVLLPDVVLEVLPQHLAQLVAHLGHGGVEYGDETSVERQQVQAGAVHAEQRPHQLLAVVLAVEGDEEIDGGVVDHLAIDAVGQVVEERLEDDLVAGRSGGGVFRFFFHRRGVLGFTCDRRSWMYTRRQNFRFKFGVRVVVSRLG